MHDPTYSRLLEIPFLLTIWHKDPPDKTCSNPTWHFHHFYYQIPLWQRLKRRFIYKCAICGKRPSWKQSARRIVVTNNNSALCYGNYCKTKVDRILSKKNPRRKPGIQKTRTIMTENLTSSNKVSNKSLASIENIIRDRAGRAISDRTVIYKFLRRALSFRVQRFQPVSNQLRSRYFSALGFFVQPLPLFVVKPDSKSLFPSHSLNKAIVLQCNDSDSTITQFLISQKLAGSGKSHANHHKPERNIMNIAFLWGQCHTPTADSYVLMQILGA